MGMLSEIRKRVSQEVVDVATHRSRKPRTGVASGHFGKAQRRPHTKKRLNILAVGPTESLHEGMIQRQPETHYAPPRRSVFVRRSPGHLVADLKPISHSRINRELKKDPPWLSVQLHVDHAVRHNVRGKQG